MRPSRYRWLLAMIGRAAFDDNDVALARVLTKVEPRPVLLRFVELEQPAHRGELDECDVVRIPSAFEHTSLLVTQVIYTAVGLDDRTHVCVVPRHAVGIGVTVFGIDVHEISGSHRD